MIKIKTFALILLFGSCATTQNRPDNMLEELIEEGIETLTGVDIDLNSTDGA